MVLFWHVIGGIIVVIFIVVLFSGRCSECGKLKAMEEVSCRLLEKVPTTIQETRKKTNKEGKVISTWTVDVPATKSIYKITLKCKYCKCEKTIRREIVQKN